MVVVSGGREPWGLAASLGSLGTGSRSSGTPPGAGRGGGRWSGALLGAGMRGRLELWGVPGFWAAAWACNGRDGRWVAADSFCI